MMISEESNRMFHACLLSRGKVSRVRGIYGNTDVRRLQKRNLVSHPNAIPKGRRTGEPMLVMMEMTGPFIMAKPWSVVERISMDEFSQLSVLLTRKLRN